MTRMHFDYETYSEVDITRVGGWNYARHPSTEVLMVAYAVDDGPVQFADLTAGPLPQEFIDLLEDPTAELHAFNAPFEYLITREVLGYPVPIDRYHCTMVLAWSLSFSGGLDAVGEQVGLAQDKRKLAEGKRLIHRFSKPAPKNWTVDRCTRETHPEQWAQFCEYCQQDVIAEREIYSLLHGYPQPESERALWLLDQQINLRGVPVDRDLIHAALKLARLEKARLREELTHLTGLDNPNSNPQFLEWLRAWGYPHDNVQGATMLKAIKEGRFDDQVCRAIELKIRLGKTSTAKWTALENAIGEDGRVRGMFQFAGAQRTKRWSGRIVQLHNLPQGRGYDTPTAADMMVSLPTDMIPVLYDDVMGLLSATVRPAIKAEPGKRLVVCDLSSIESRILGYVAGCERINRIFREGMDTYKDFATELFHVLYEQVTKDQRTYAKPATLGCGYQLGAEGLVTYAEGMGVTMDYEDAREAVDTFRRVYPEVPAMWAWLVDAVKSAILNWTTHTGYGVRILRDHNFLFIELMSGRRLAYYRPAVLPRVPPWGGKPLPTITYMGMNSYTHRWERISTHGGKITENIVQAMARDVLKENMFDVTRAQLDIIGHVHDELIVQIEQQYAEQALAVMERCMSQSPTWAPDMLLGAEGFITQRYRKD